MTLSTHFVLKALDRLTIGRLTLHLPDGTVRRFGNPSASREAVLEVRDWRFFRRVLLDGDLGFAEAYMEGYCDSPDLPRLISLLAENQQALGKIANSNVVHNLALKLLHRWRQNSRAGSKRNIHAHYDLGNRFYGLWLDPTMSYSSALFGGESKSLEAAQAAKYERVLTQLGAKQGDTILEIGCGWGGFAEVAAR
ncbi:MAG TPA: class I SAM-dependent methyltransferase, partial [Reyranella sp.]|nr:class I SAM-dependent methyltransferase [Reyranella sp.]